MQKQVKLIDKTDCDDCALQHLLVIERPDNKIMF